VGRRLLLLVWKQVVISYLRVLPQNPYERTEENRERRLEYPVTTFSFYRRVTLSFIHSHTYSHALAIFIVMRAYRTFKLRLSTDMNTGCPHYRDTGLVKWLDCIAAVLRKAESSALRRSVSRKVEHSVYRPFDSNRYRHFV